MYKKIRVSGFRGADDIVLDRLGRLNILVGRNNTGKSSCLEAVSLMSSGRDLFKNAFGESTLERILGRRVGTDEGWKHLIHDCGERAVVEGVQDSGAVETLEVAGSPHSMKNVPATEQLEELSSRTQGGASQPQENVLHEACFHHSGGDRPVLGKLYATDGGLRSETAPAAPPCPRAAAGTSLFMERPYAVPGELYKRVASSGRIHDVIARLKVKIPAVNDIRQIDGEVYVFFEDRTKRPLSLVGDGFRSAVLLSMSGHLVEGGTMAIEEPENHTHPAMVYHVVDELLIGCRDHNNQVFLSTHSDDLVEHALMAAPSKEYVSVFRLSRSDCETYVESFDMDEAYEHRITLGLDMRGM